MPLSFWLQGREGEIVRIDRFGNCITNLPALPGRTEYEACIEVGRLPARLKQVATYREAPPGEPVAIVNSYGTLEIAVRDGNAAEVIGTRVQSRVTLA